MRVLFIGHNGYGYPHTRVRCYHFARVLAQYPGMETAVLSFRDDLAPHKSEGDIYLLRDREKLILTLKALAKLVRERETIFYIQKAHFHSAASFFLHRLGICPYFIFDYDDYDIPLSNFFSRGIWNRIFFGSNQWDEITYRLIANAKGCVAASHYLIDFMQKHNQEVAYIPTGVDTDIFTPSTTKPMQPLTFLWNGLVWGEPVYKNVLYLFKAFSLVHKELPSYRIQIIGGGEWWQRMKEKIQSDYAFIPVEWHDWVAPQEMPMLIRNADVGLLPTDGNDEWLQSKSPTKLFEYMASGLPVVASGTGEAVYVQDHGKTGFLANGYEEFAETIVQLAKDSSLRLEMGKKARNLIETNFSLPILGKNLYNFIQKIF